MNKNIIALTMCTFVFTSVLNAASPAVETGQVKALIEFLETETFEGKGNYASVLEVEIKRLQEQANSASKLKLSGKLLSKNLITSKSRFSQNEYLVEVEFVAKSYSPNTYLVLRDKLNSDISLYTSMRLSKLAQHRVAFKALDKVYAQVLLNTSTPNKTDGEKNLSVWHKVKSDLVAKQASVYVEISDKSMKTTRKVLGMNLELQKHLVGFFAQLSSGLLKEAYSESKSVNKLFFNNERLNISYGISKIKINLEFMVQLFVAHYLSHKMQEDNCGQSDFDHVFTEIEACDVIAKRADEIGAFIRLLQNHAGSKDVIIRSLQEAFKTSLDTDNERWKPSSARNKAYRFIMSSEYILSPTHK